MKKVYAVVRVLGEGTIDALQVVPTGCFKDECSLAGGDTRTYYQMVVNKNTELEAMDVARQLAAKYPGQRYDVVSTIVSYTARTPVTETTKFD